MTMSRPLIIATTRELVDLFEKLAASHPDSMPVTRDGVVVGTLVNIRVENGCIVGDYEETAK